MKTLSRILFLLSLPDFLLSPIPAAAFYQESKAPIHGNEVGEIFEIPRDEFGRVNPWVLFLPENLSIDRYFAFIDLVENEAFLESLTEEEFDITVDFITRMVQSSLPESMGDLKEIYELEIDELMDDLYGKPKLSFSLNRGFDFEINPAICLQKPEFFLCKGWIKKKAHHFGHWCKKHTKPLVAGAVAITVMVVAALTGGVGGSSPTPVGGALTDEDLDGIPSPHINKPGEVFVADEKHSPPSSNSFTQNDTPFCHTEPQYTPSKEPTPLEKAHILTFEQTEQAKRDIIEIANDPVSANEKTALDNVKNVTKTIVSNIVHDVFESVSNIGTYWHELQPNSTPEDARVYKEYIAAQHAKIDEIFGTDHPIYTIESQEHLEAFKAAVIEELGHYPEIKMGKLPPPGALISAVSRAASVASRTIGIVARSGGTIGSVAAASSMIKWESPIPTTQANDVRGWKVSDPINNRTINGNVPTWSAVRYRYWRNKELAHREGRAIEPQVYEATEENLARMKKGLAPQTYNEKTDRMESIELHHKPPQREGGKFDFVEVTPQMHENIDPYRNLGEVNG